MVSVCYFYSVQLKHDLLYDNSTECFWIMLIQDLEYHNFHFHSIRRQRKLRTINHLIIINQRKYWTKNLLNHFAGGRDFFSNVSFLGSFLLCDNDRRNRFFVVPVVHVGINTAWMESIELNISWSITLLFYQNVGERFCYFTTYNTFLHFMSGMHRDEKIAVAN